LQKKNSSVFTSQVDGRLFVEVPFSFDPFYREWAEDIKRRNEYAKRAKETRGK
jgi:hypothetical protein